MGGVIYKITNRLNGKPYVGRTIRHVLERFKEHINGTLFVDREIHINDGMNNVSTSTSSAKEYETPKDPISIVRGIIGRKWKWELLWYLHERENTRFNELKRRIPGISNLMLTKSLRELEADGLVVRREPVSMPPKVVEYSLTDFGKELIPVLNELYAWGQKVMLNES